MGLSFSTRAWIAAASSNASLADAASRSVESSRTSESPAESKIGLHAVYFCGIFFVGAAFEAGREAHLHLGIDAAGEFRVGMQVVDAAAHLEEVQRIVHELLGGDAREERAVVERASAEPAKPRGDGGARVFVFEMQLHQRREAEAQAVGIGLGKGGPQDAVEQEAGLEVRSGGRVLDCADAVAQVELLGALFDGPEQALEAASQVCGFADIGLGFGVAPRRRKTAGLAGTAEKISASRSGANSRRSVSTRSL